MDGNKSLTAVFTQDTADPDNDGLTNYQELVIHGTNPDLWDTDDDGFSDGYEVTGGGNPWNAYGWSVRQAYIAGGSSNITTAIRSVEGNDADGDGSSNLIEITANTLPGWTKGNNNSYFFKNGTVTTGNAPITTTTPSIHARLLLGFSARD